MKRTMTPLTFLAVITIFFLASCNLNTYDIYVPEYMSFESMRAATALKTDDLPEMVNPGKLYLLDNLLFVGERSEGVHVVSLEDPANPIQIAFLQIPGNTDIAILQKDGQSLLYADSYIDLVIFNITADPDNFQAEELERLEEVFPNDPYQIFIDDPLVPWFSGLDLEDQVVIGYTVETVTEQGYWGGDLYMDVAAESGSGTSGTGGSMARFTLYGDETDTWYLYAVDEWDMRIFDLSTPSAPLPEVVKSIGWGIETIFPYKNHLYIGSSSAMYIYGLDNPANPEQLSEVTHFTSRDPVAVAEVGSGSTDTAFVTLRSESGWGVDQLMAYDVSDPFNPEELVTMEMWNPHGLAVRGDRLFLCEGTGGFKAFDVTNLYDTSLADHERIDKIAQTADLESYDVIALDSFNIVIGADGLYLYTLNETVDPAQLDLLGSIPVDSDTLTE